MDFWGEEVKPGQTLNVDPGEDKYIHISQVAFGEIHPSKVEERVVVHVHADDKKYVVGTLIPGKSDQFSLDVVFSKPFKLSHTYSKGSVHFVGYNTPVNLEDDTSDDYSDESSEDDEALREAILAHENAGKKDAPAAGGAKAVTKTDAKVVAKTDAKVVAKTDAKGVAKTDNKGDAKPKAEAAKSELKTGSQKKKDQKKLVKPPEPSSEDDDDVSEDDDEEDEDEDGDDDQDTTDASSDDEDGSDDEDDDDEDEDDDEEEEDEEENKKQKNVKVEAGKKRSAPESALKTPPTDKKAKVTTSEQKKGTPANNVQTPAKKGQTPKPATASKQSPKTPATASGKKLEGHACNSCSKSFTTEQALSQHNTAKHGSK